MGLAVPISEHSPRQNSEHVACCGVHSDIDRGGHVGDCALTVLPVFGNGIAGDGSDIRAVIADFVGFHVLCHNGRRKNANAGFFRNGEADAVSVDRSHDSFSLFYFVESELDVDERTEPRAIRCDFSRRCSTIRLVLLPNLKDSELRVFAECFKHIHNRRTKLIE